jgi:hypothetical protein
MTGLQAFDVFFRVPARRILFRILIVCLGLVLAKCSPVRRDEVLVVEKTNTYHIMTCSRVNMAEGRFMALEDARAAHYSACPGCKPDSVIARQQEHRN